MILIHNATLVNWTPREIATDQAVLIRDGIIADIGVSADLVTRYPDAERFDAKDRLLMPGNVCAHTHFYGAFARGLGISGPAPPAFPEMLCKLWWPPVQSLKLN